MEIFDEIRSTCAMVAKKPVWVSIRHHRLAAYASELPLVEIATTEMDWEHHFRGEEVNRVAYFLTLAAVNFGSGYFPHLAKAPGLTGYYTIAKRLRDRFAEQGPIAAEALADMDVEKCSRLFQQSEENQVAQELMAHFSRAMQQLGRHLLNEHRGSFCQLVSAAQGSAACLVTLLSQMPYFNDRQNYLGQEVLLFKRAQLAVADLHLAFEGRGPGHFCDLDQLTIFADNIVPHVLHLDGILEYDPDLKKRIQAGGLIPAGSPEEVELRACAVHAVELLRATPAAAAAGVSAQQLDYLLWHRGQQKHYKAVPRHRTRSIFY